MIAEGDAWQIFLTNHGTYVLAVLPQLYARWCKDHALPVGLFQKIEGAEGFILPSANGYLIASVDKGPFPKKQAQIEAFSVAVQKSLKESPALDLRNAIYVEEFSLLLPTAPDIENADNGAAYGRWLAGGIGISITNFDRMSEILSWLPGDVLLQCAQTAGFDVEKPKETNKEELALRRESAKTALMDKERFVLPGRPELEAFFNESIIDIVINQEQYARMGIGFPGATVLHGPPGSGKTYAVERLAEYLQWPRFDIDSDTVASPYIHDTSKKVAEVFEQAISNAPSILVIDEMEAFLSNRNNFGSGTHHVEEVAEFLRKIPEAVEAGVLIFAMTNLLDTIDPAVIRKGRFDNIIEVKLANADEIQGLLVHKLQELPIAEDVCIRPIAEKLADRPLSDVAFILREAGKAAIKQNLDVIDQHCFDVAIEQLVPKEEKRRIGFV
ncbi:MAG: ATP-binding protein [Oscillospiraceae bacterium]|nr:ATP-binding protein [Oscillospiraceae bacterium]